MKINKIIDLIKKRKKLSKEMEGLVFRKNIINKLKERNGKV